MDPFKYYLRVRYIECDAQKVVFNSRYAEYVDVGVSEFLRAAGVFDSFITGALDFLGVPFFIAYIFIFPLMLRLPPEPPDRRPPRLWRRP